MTTDNSFTFNPVDVTEKQMYKLMIGSVVPRPIAWVSSTDEEGVLNIAPFSFFTVASRNPPTLVVSITREKGDGAVKDTLANIKATEEFVINVVPETLANKMYWTSGEYPADVNEFDQGVLTPQPSGSITPPAIKESPIAFECRLHQMIEVGTDYLVLGTVQQVNVEKEVYLGDHKIDFDYWKPLTRVGKDYASLSNSFTLPK